MKFQDYEIGSLGPYNPQSVAMTIGHGALRKSRYVGGDEI